MPKLSEVVLPVLAGLVSAASPYAARGVGAGLDVYQTIKRRKAQQDAAAAEEARRQALAQALMGGQGPYGDAARQLAQAGAVEPALGLFTEGIRSRAKQDEDRAEQLRRSLEPPAPPKVETRTEEDPATGQKYAVRYENGVRVSAEPVFGRPAPKHEKQEPDWVPRGSFVSDDGYHTEVLFNPRTQEFKQERIGKARVSQPAEPGAKQPRITSLGRPEVEGAEPAATVVMPTGETEVLPLGTANAVVRDAAAGAPVPLLTRMRGGDVAVASPARPRVPAPRQRFRNRKTGQLEEFELQGGKWVPVR